MTEPTSDQIRRAVGRAMADAPAPHPWADVEQRAQHHGAPPPAGSRFGIWLAAAACIVTLIGGLALLAVPARTPADLTDDDTDNPMPSSPAASTDSSTDDVETATAFWEALAARDRDAALSLVDPAFVVDGAGTPFGRAWTLERQFDWYDAVGWRWTFEGCVSSDAGAVECAASASNAWSEALGVEPVTGTFVMSVGDDGILVVTEDPAHSFDAQWLPMVFDVFADWVETNRPDDARVMFDFGVDVNPEILAMYEDNTARFVEAQQNQ